MSYLDDAVGSVGAAGTTFLPEQYNEAMRRSRARDGEHRLAAAILEDALLAWTMCNNTLGCYEPARAPALKNRMRLEAERWFSGEYEVPNGFTFEYVCDVLGFDADWLRGRMANFVGGHQVKRFRSPVRANGVLVDE